MRFSWHIASGLLLAALGAFSPCASANAVRQVVYIGDSHSLGVVGEVVAQGLRSQPQIDYFFSASGGSAPLQWINHRFSTPCGYVDSSALPQSPPRKCISGYLTPTFESLLADAIAREPELSVGQRLAVIVLGTNFSNKPEDRDFQVRAAASLMRTAHSRGFLCLWFGAPDMQRFRGEMIEQSYAVIENARRQVSDELGSDPCQIVDSRAMSRYPMNWNPSTSKPDGIHYDYPGGWYRFPEGRASGAEWGASMLRQILAD